MSRFDYKVIRTTYGKKLCIMWDDYDDYPDDIKDLDWETTHRSMYNPDWDDAHENVAHGKVDRPCWHIDYNRNAVTLFERMFSTRVPGEYKPETSNAGCVDIVIPDGHSEFFVEHPRSEVDRILDAEFSYEAPNAQYTTSYKNGTWDGIVHVYDDNSHSAPVGLVQRAVSTLEEEGFDVSLDDERTGGGTVIDTTWQGEDLRPYQHDAVGAVMNEGGGVVSIPTGGGKTYVACYLIDQLKIEAGRALVVVHTQELLYQWADEVRELLGVEPGLIGDGQWSEGPVTIAIGQTLVSRGAHQLDDDYGAVYFDECHRTSAAETFHEVGLDVDVQWRIGLSATPWRRVTGEEVLIKGAVGEAAYEVTPERLIDEGYLAIPTFEVLDPTQFGDPRKPANGQDYHAAYEDCIETDPIRNLAVATRAAHMAADGRQVLINVNRVAQGILLELMLNPDADRDERLAEIDDADKRRGVEQALRGIGQVAEWDARMVHASTDDRTEVLDDFDDGEQRIVISTLVKEGVDLPELDAVILAHGGKSSVETIQVIGRALRPSSEDARIVDVKDEGRYFGDAFTQRQTTLRDYYGDYYDIDVLSGRDEVDAGDDKEALSLTSEPPTFEEVFGEQD